MNFKKYSYLLEWSWETGICLAVIRHHSRETHMRAPSTFPTRWASQTLPRSILVIVYVTGDTIRHYFKGSCPRPDSWEGDRRTLRWKCKTMIISPSHGWNKACLMLLYRMSTLSPRTDVKRKPGDRWTELLSIKQQHGGRPEDAASFLVDPNGVRAGANRYTGPAFPRARRAASAQPPASPRRTALPAHLQACPKRSPIPLTWASSEPCILFWAMFGRMYRSFSLGLLRLRLITRESCFTMP